jgi:bifunctional hydroxylase/dehydrase
MTEFDTDVIVVGAGPTGLMLAGELRLGGVDVTVLDRLAEPMKQSRALGFSARTIEEFDQRGLLPRFGELQTIPIGHFGGLPIDYRVLDGGSYGARGKPQSLTESILADWATGLGARLHRDHEVVALNAGDDGAGNDGAGNDGAGVTVVSPAGRRSLRARYVIGCDGGRSTIRRLAGIGFPGTDPVIEMWLADVAGCELRPRFSGERVPGGMVMVLPMGPAVNRVVVYDRDCEPGQGPPAFTDVAKAWQRLTGEDIHGGTPLWVSSFTDSSRQASEYRRDRVFVAGDAAHVHMPIGGQGMSAGIQDSVNLGWKLAAAIRGWAPEGLLDSYHSERHPVGSRVLANTLAQRILYLSGDEMEPLRTVLAELLGYPDVRRHLVGMVTGLDIRYDVGCDHPLAGRRVPSVELATANGEPARTSTFGRLHAARGVLFDLARNAGLRDAAAGWADRVEVVTATPPAGSPLDDVPAVLVRPDGYIVWAGRPGQETGGLPAALTRWFGRSCP